MIIETIKQNRQRKILLLSDRIETLNILESMLKSESISFVSVHEVKIKEQVSNMEKVKLSS